MKCGARPLSFPSLLRPVPNCHRHWAQRERPDFALGVCNPSLCDPVCYSGQSGLCSSGRRLSYLASSCISFGWSNF